MRSLVAAILLLIVTTGCDAPVDATVEDTPIKIISEHIGVGKPADEGDLVTIDYRILTEDGTEVLRAKGYRFILGTAAVIEGVEDAVTGMRVSGDRVVRCPPHRHWGRGGYGDLVPANAFLTISIRLDAID